MNTLRTILCAAALCFVAGTLTTGCGDNCDRQCIKATAANVNLSHADCMKMCQK